ncbi:MAG: hypothetical protein GY861_05875 [bacterium]|nr:hypothetical protein [bacterium]
MKHLVLILAMAAALYSYEYDTTGIPILILERRCDNMFTDTLKDTCLCYHNMDPLYWKILYRDKSTGGVIEERYNASLFSVRRDWRGK